jgi:EAL domain-containing protein (putative c-di-GMP-specific phosphodiesterase class I)/GGDEF domain-containing protein
MNNIAGQRDALTGLPGMAAVRAKLEDWISQSKVAGEGLRLHALLLGLRRFDTLNLAYGTAAGDAALAEVAARLSHFAGRELEGPWLAARTGGNFVLIANETCSRQRWQLFAGQLADVVARPLSTHGPSHGAVLRLSPRIALLRGVNLESAESVLDRLSQTLANMGGQQGRRLSWADGETTRPGRTAAQLEADLLRAIDAGEIELVFQPQFSLPQDCLTGAEALTRWNHPKLGRIGAGALFAVAERADHIVPLSRHIARLALAGAKAWPDHLRLSLNVTAFELASEIYADELLAVLNVSGFPPQRLTLEVTEQALLADIQIAARTLTRLSEAGIRIALDDFGAGFCNFRYLKLLPLDYLKLDRSMVDGIISDARDLAVFRAIVAMAHALGLAVIVEGIETEAQRELIAEEGANFYQGFLRAKPMSGADFAALTLT